MDTVAGNSYKLTGNERERIDNILKKSIDVEKGLLPRPEVTEENPDGRKLKFCSFGIKAISVHCFGPVYIALLI